MSEKSVLVVDDELLIRDLLYDFFLEKGYKVSVADSGSVALDKLGKQSFDVLLVDLKMPAMDGIEFIKEVRRKKIDTPVVIITGFPSLETALDALRQRVHDYIIKPFNINQLFATVRRAVDGSKPPSVS
ncbi:MAG TPA: response regulator [candidate division Zixibacteria bacterium]|nr:response regulator [candidate division Zixibacteria bacterium]